MGNSIQQLNLTTCTPVHTEKSKRQTEITSQHLHPCYLSKSKKYVYGDILIRKVVSGHEHVY